ncbi:UDP-glycosyltransferase UGT5 [Plutella xylostella]|uniref:UDP-glycosyltransferase UGT5 n=1 Tax=Plutella xylostella TaxID=51655 RepID=UPI002032F687|nr:UDP-glycosyltransferase UGT5 [Plutella xylostella]
MLAPLILLSAGVAALAGPAGAARVLGLFPHSGRSHQMVFEPLLRALAERGHHVTVVSFFPLDQPPANYTDVSLEGISPIGVETVNIEEFESLYSPYAWPRVLGVDRVLSQFLGFHPLAEMAVNICSKLVELPTLREALQKKYDVVLVENFSSDCMLGLLQAYGVQAPRVALLSSNLMPWSAERIGAAELPSYVPTVSTEFTDRMTFLQRMENSFVKLGLKQWFHYLIQEKEQELIEKSLGKKVDLQALAKNTSLMLVNTFHGLNGVRPTVPGLVEVGGMHLQRARKPIPPFMEKFLDESPEGVILFSWGSLIKTASIPPHREQVLVRVLSRLPQRVIWKYEGSAPEGNLTGNILRVNWIPQYELLLHKKVIAFIAHGGLLGMTEGISAGKPMLVVPFFGDQPCNGAAAEAVGLGTVLRYADLNEEAFGEAVRKVLSAPMRLSARQVSKIWRDRQTEPLETAVYWTERVARWGAASPLHSSARDLPFYELYLLDILAAALLAVVALLIVLRIMVKMLMYFLAALFVKQPKKKVH